MGGSDAVLEPDDRDERRKGAERGDQIGDPTDRPVVRGMTSIDEEMAHMMSALPEREDEERGEQELTDRQDS